MTYDPSDVIARLRGAADHWDDVADVADPARDGVDLAALLLEAANLIARLERELDDARVHARSNDLPLTRRPIVSVSPPDDEIKETR